MPGARMAAPAGEPYYAKVPLGRGKESFVKSNDSYRGSVFVARGFNCCAVSSRPDKINGRGAFGGKGERQREDIPLIRARYEVLNRTIRRQQLITRTRLHTRRINESPLH